MTTKADEAKQQPEQLKSPDPIEQRPMVSYPMPYRPGSNEPPPVEVKLPKRRARRR